MMSLEQTLAGILRQIDEMKAGGDAVALAELLERKDAICRMLCALEQG